MATVEEKAAAFDALVKELQGKARFVKEHYYLEPSNIVGTFSFDDPIEISNRPRRYVSIYEWRIRGIGKDIEALLLGPQRRG